jgi:hydroxymethylglutaryl-CoA lyase
MTVARCASSKSARATACRTKRRSCRGDKIELIESPERHGLDTIEATSFVSPNGCRSWPMRRECIAAIDKKPGVRYPVLVPNLQGYERARGRRTEIAVFTAASEAFNRKNINASIDESIERFMPVMERARADGVSGARLCLDRARLPVPGRRAGRRRRARRATPARPGLLRDLAGRHDRHRHAGKGARDAAAVAGGSADEPRSPCTSTIRAARRSPISSPASNSASRSSIIGFRTGGCPYARGATGNVASEDVAYMLHGMGIATGVDLAS